jgi:chromosome segregation ATPase
LDSERAAVADTQAKLRTEAKALADLRAKLVTIRSEIEAGVKVREAEVHRKEQALEAERTKLQASAGALARTEAQLSEQRSKMEGQLAALAAKEAMYEERHRQLQENMKNFVRT